MSGGQAAYEAAFKFQTACDLLKAELGADVFDADCLPSVGAFDDDDDDDDDDNDDDNDDDDDDDDNDDGDDDDDDDDGDDDDIDDDEDDDEDDDDDDDDDGDDDDADGDDDARCLMPDAVCAPTHPVLFFFLARLYLKPCYARSLTHSLTHPHNGKKRKRTQEMKAGMSG
eukprot:675741-Rhodomonas_salina.2